MDLGAEAESLGEEEVRIRQKWKDIDAFDKVARFEYP